LRGATWGNDWGEWYISRNWIWPPEFSIHWIKRIWLDESGPDEFVDPSTDVRLFLQGQLVKAP
jgi:hypothetical protein